MSLNKFSNTYQQTLEPFFAKVDGDFQDNSGTSCLKGIPANLGTANSLTITFNGSPNLLTPGVNYCINDGTYVDMYITEPFTGTFTSNFATLEVTLRDIHPSVRPSVDGTYTTIIGTSGTDYGYSAYSFTFSDNGSTVTISFLQNSRVAGAYQNIPLNLSLNLRLMYPL